VEALAQGGRLKIGRILWLTALTLAVLLVAAYGVSRLTDRPGDKTVPNAPDTTGVRLERVASGLRSPVHLTAPAGDDRIFVVEQAGRIRVIRGGQLVPGAWLDIEARVGSGGERGLLSLAFHPGFRANGRFFVNYTDRRGNTHIAEFHADPAADAADAASEKQLLAIDQPYANHNGGHILFGPDGALYAGMGDGGAAGDPHGNAQDRDAKLGKLLRIDVDTRAVSTWAIGLRNPWRMAFDSGLIYIADVGQGSWEEINVAPAREAGLNYGWRVMEGAHCFVNPVCSKQGLVLPAAEYDHGNGCSVTGGVVYRGRAAPVLAGHYVYSDYCSGWLRSFRYANGVATEHRSWSVQSPGPVSSFGTDANGEVFVVVHTGEIYRIVGN
jgi:glucose/arabinose dehydrogenase